MKILIDIGLFDSGKKSGIGHHIVNLVRKLKLFVQCDLTDYQYINMFPRYIKKWIYIAWSYFTSKSIKYEIVHHLHTCVPRKRGNELHIMTVYDLSVLLYPETISFGWRHYNRYAFKQGLAKSDGLIVISESVKKELIINYPRIDNQKIFFCPPGIRESMIDIEPDRSRLESIGLTQNGYFLFVGDLTKRKNLDFLLNAFIEAKEAERIAAETGLILVGKPAWGFSELKSLIKEDFGICRTGYLEDDSIAALYRYCKALVFPSIYEGFGIPIIEAMWYKSPIIASAIPTSLELHNRHNKQLFLFELGDKSRLMDLLENVDRNAEQLRSALDYGNISQYKYEAIAKKHVEIYKSVLNRSK